MPNSILLTLLPNYAVASNCKESDHYHYHIAYYSIFRPYTWTSHNMHGNDYITKWKVVQSFHTTLKWGLNWKFDPQFRWYSTKMLFDRMANCRGFNKSELWCYLDAVCCFLIFVYVISLNMRENGLQKTGWMINSVRIEIAVVHVAKNNRKNGQHNVINEATNNALDINVALMLAFVVYSVQIFK